MGDAMNLFTKKITERLTKNGLASLRAIMKDGNTPDHAPVVKWFNPAGAATWLLTELEVEVIDGTVTPTGRIYGLCDLGMGEPEMGYLDIAEITGFRGTFGLGIERDRYFTGSKPISEYAADARNTGRITV